MKALLATLLLTLSSLLPAQTVSTVGRAHGLEWVWGDQGWHWHTPLSKKPRTQVLLHVREHGTEHVRFRIHCLWVGMQSTGPVNLGCLKVPLVVAPVGIVGQGFIHDQPEWGYVLQQWRFRPVHGFDYLLQVASFSTSGPCHKGFQTSSIIKVRY